MCAHACVVVLLKIGSLVYVFVWVCAFLIDTCAHIHRTWQLCLVSLATPVECCQGCNEHAQSDRQTDRELAVGKDYKAINNWAVCGHMYVCVCTR